MSAEVWNTIWGTQKALGLYKAQHETMRDVGSFDEDVVAAAIDAILFERARTLLLGGAASNDLR